MGFFDRFKKKAAVPEAVPVEVPEASAFRHYYLYGFTDSPNRSSTDSARFADLYRLVIGKIGGIAVTNSYHPYFLVNTKGLSAWTAAYVRLATADDKEALLARMASEHAVFAVDTDSMFTTLNVWPDDRLTTDKTPLFAQYVPFVIPFLVLATDAQTAWDLEIATGIALQGHAQDYVERVTAAIRFLLPEPAFIIGFGEFDERNPSGLIDKFIACQPLFDGSAG